MNILITGGASGLGEKITKNLLQNKNNTVYFTFNSSKENANKISSEYSNSKAINCDFNNLISVKLSI